MQPRLDLTPENTEFSGVQMPKSWSNISKYAKFKLFYQKNLQIKAKMNTFGAKLPIVGVKLER